LQATRVVVVLTSTLIGSFYTRLMHYILLLKLTIIIIIVILIIIIIIIKIIVIIIELFLIIHLFMDFFFYNCDSYKSGYDPRVTIFYCLSDPQV